MMKILRTVHVNFSFILMIETEEAMVIDNQVDAERRRMENSVNIPITIDQLYNMIVCDECGIGLPFEWIASHLKDNHGIKMEMVNVMRHLNMMKPSMRLKEAKEWIKSV